MAVVADMDQPSVGFCREMKFLAKDLKLWGRFGADLGQ